jgi:hypothetical protein
MIAYSHIYDSLAEFMAGLDPAKVLSFHAPEEIQTQVEELLEKKREEGLGEQEEEELEHYFILEHIVRLAKSRDRLLLSKGQA